MDAQKTDSTQQQPQGALDRLRSATPDSIKNNAPRVVAALKIMGSSSMFLSKNKVFSTAGAGFITANSIALLFGSKKSEEQKEHLREQEDSKHMPQSGLSNYVYKFLHPSKYPLESASTVATASSILWTAAGVYGKGGFSPGRLIGGAFSLASDANLAFTKERFSEPEANTSPKGSLGYYATELKHRPVLLSSLLNIACDAASIIGGAHEYSKGKEINTLLAGSFLLSANTFQAIYVNKNDYNIEPSHAMAKKAANDDSYAARIKQPQSGTWQQKVQSRPSQSAMALQA